MNSHANEMLMRLPPSRLGPSHHPGAAQAGGCPLWRDTRAWLGPAQPLHLPRWAGAPLLGPLHSMFLPQRKVTPICDVTATCPA